MREININIEGYNVNGICVGCLNYDREMFYSDEVKQCFKTLADIDVPDGLTIQVCWECLAYVRRVNKFQQQILKVYDVLMDYSRQHTFLNSPRDLSEQATQRLASAHNTVRISCTPVDKDQDIDIEVDVDAEPKLEDISVDEMQLELKDDIKVEVEDNFLEFDLEPIKPETDYSQDSADFQNPVSSDEDVQLSQLKREKGKRERKIKREKKIKKKKRENRKSKSKPEPSNTDETPPRTRKLKNLPPDLVELYTMSEEEMWQIRSEDVDSKEFTKLKYKCDECIIGFNSEKLMKYHLNGKHRQKAGACQQCDVCKAYLLTKDNLSVHRSLHLAAYKCKLCPLVTTLKKSMMKHLRVHSDSVERFECGTCGEVFSTKSKLSYHKYVCHQDRPQCDCCGKVFANKMTLKYHLKMLGSQNKEEKPKEKLYIPCKGCNKVFTSKKSYRAHVVIHEGLTYPCPICGKLFQWKRNLARHTRNHREKDAGALHECRECGKTFSSRDCYNNHMRLSKRHVPEDCYSHECNYCGKKFATKWCMVDHIDWDHLKRIKYQCSVCFKAFKTAKIMVAHMNNIHEGKRSREPDGEHLCEICGKSYKTVKRLKGHVWAMHTNRSNTKSFKCKLCPATFTWQTSIYKHIKMMHDHTKRGKQQARGSPLKKPRSESYETPYYTQNMLPVPMGRPTEPYPIIPT